MDPNSGRLRALSDEEFSVLSLMKKENIPEQLKGLESLPEKLNDEAIKELAGREECFVDLKSDTPLARWAKKKRMSAAQKKKKRRKMANKSKKINRKK